MTITKEEAIQKIRDGSDFSDPLFDPFRDDREFVLEAVKIDGFVLCFASKELLADKEVVLAAVRQDGLVFEYADHYFKSDKELAIEAIKSLRSKSSWGKLDVSVTTKTLRLLRECFPELHNICRGTDKDPIEALEEALIKERKQNFEAALQDKPAVKRKKTF